MSKIMDMITSQLGSGLLDQVAGQLGGNKDNTQRAVAAALPMLLEGLRRNTQSNEGASSLSNALQRDHQSSNILGSLGSLMTSQSNQSAGSKILNHILGSKQQQVSRQLGQATGLGSQNTGQLLSMLAPVVMGALGKVQKESSLDARGLQNFLGQEQQQLQKKQPQMGMLGSLLDSDGDGDVDMGDMLSKGSGLLGAFFKR